MTLSGPEGATPAPPWSQVFPDPLSSTGKVPLLRISSQLCLTTLVSDLMVCVSSVLHMTSLESCEFQSIIYLLSLLSGMQETVIQFQSCVIQAYHHHKGKNVSSKSITATRVRDPTFKLAHSLDSQVGGSLLRTGFYSTQASLCGHLA